MRLDNQKFDSVQLCRCVGIGFGAGSYEACYSFQ